MPEKTDNPLRSRVTLVEVEDTIVERISNQSAPRLEVTVLESVEHLLTASSLGTLECEVVVLGKALTDPVRVAQHVQKLDKNIQIIILSTVERSEDYFRQIEFSPFLGDAVSLIAADKLEELKSIIGRAVKRAHRRCSYSREAKVAGVNGKSGHANRDAIHYLGNVLDNAPIGMLTLDSNGRIQTLNKRGAEILNVRERDVLDTSFPGFFMPVDRIRLDRVMTEKDEYVGHFRIGQHGEDARFVEISATDYVSRSGQPGNMVILHDVTDRVAAEQARVSAAAALQASEDRFLELAEVLPMIPWEAKAATQRFTFIGGNAGELTGYAKKDWYKVDFWSKLLHPDDREKAIRTRQNNARRLQNFDHEYRIITADGETKWMHDIVNVVRDNHAKAKKLRGFMIDVTEKYSKNAADTDPD
ncbi:MAG: PAS domain S-box protein [Gammaproteobacteria bacterium]|nr:PAS domain S-box protein [Gammaproteobacteria bacterium]